MIYVGIDPGEHWTGIAVLYPKGKRKWFAEMATLDVGQRLYRAAAFLMTLPSPSDITVVCEDYRVRPEGYNQFTAARTARAIGACEFVCHISPYAFHLVAPADPDKQLPLLGLSNILELWRNDWPKPRASTWGHARSAWRVLGHFLLTEDPDLLRGLGAGIYTQAGKGKPTALLHGTTHDGVKTSSTVTATGGGLGDLTAPRAIWGIRRKS